MLTDWFNNDINKMLVNSGRVVIVEPKGESSFLLEGLNDDITVIGANKSWGEIEAKYKAVTECEYRNVAFYAAIDEGLHGVRIILSLRQKRREVICRINYLGWQYQPTD